MFLGGCGRSRWDRLTAVLQQAHRDRLKAVVQLVGTLMLLVLSTNGAAAGPEPSSPNFVVIVCDNLGYGDIEPFGADHHRTPNLNRMAREGRRFTHFYATAGVCTPSRASLLTGCYAQRVGLHTNPRDGIVLRPVSSYGLAPSEITIAESLKPLGYATALIGKWHLGDQLPFLPNRQGFDMYWGIPYSDDMTQAAGKRWSRRQGGPPWPPLPLMHNDQVIEAPVDRTRLTKRYTDRALQFIQRHHDRPFLLIVAHAMPGSTATPFASESFQGSSPNGPWGDAVEELDWSTGQILDKLVALNIDNRTLVVWTSDNGAPIQNNSDDLSRGSNRPLHGRGYSTSEGAFRVPTIMWWPGSIPAQTTCGQLATTMDLLPTMLAFAGGTLTKSRAIDGHDIRPLIVGQRNAQSPYRAFFYYFANQLQAVRSGPWKLFLPLEKFANHPHFHHNQKTTPLLFHVVEDVACRHNVAQDHPEIVQRLMRLADSARNRFGDTNQRGSDQRQAGRVDDPTPQRKQ